MLSKEFIIENKATINLQDLEFRIRHRNNIIEIYAELDGVMVGYAKFNERADKTLVAGKVTVDPDYRRQGIATAIYNYAEQQGYTVIPSETQTELGREFWKDRKNKQGVAEGRNLPGPQPLEQKTFNELQASLGKTATNSMIKHPWYAEYGMYEKAYKHSVDGSNFHEVMVYPYMSDIHTTAEGKIRPTIMLQFSFSPRGKVIQVHKFIRDKEPSKEELRHPGSGWRLAKSWKKQEDVL